MKSLFNHFEILEDPRDIRGKKHKLINILVMTIYGILCGYTDFTNLADFLKVHEDCFNNLSLIPANRNLAGAEIELITKEK